jgi:D-aminopeptidase
VTHLKPAEGSRSSRTDHRGSSSISADTIETLPPVGVVDRGTVEFRADEYTPAVQALATLIGEWSLPETARRTAA